MDPKVPALPADISVAHARSSIRDAAGHATYYVYVVDRDDLLIGVLDLRQLLDAPSSRTLESMMPRPADAVAAAAERAEILSHPAWRELHDLPVVDGEGRFLGVLRYETMKRLETDRPPERLSDRALGTALAFGELCWITWGEMIRGVASLSSSKPVGRPGHSEVDRDASI